jgi:hypothetical protein
MRRPSTALLFGIWLGLTSEGALAQQLCGTIDTSALGTWGGKSSVAAVFAANGDTNATPTRSKVQIFESGRRLGPAHALHADIINYGAGRFSHWYNYLVFSASDNSNPATNGRVYTYGVSSGACPTQVCQALSFSSLPNEGLAFVLSPFSPTAFINHRQQVMAADTSTSPTASQLRLFEGYTTQLGPAHTLHQAIRDSGSGAFSHWYTTLYFSASDSTNPTTNGRPYFYGAPVCSRERAPALVIAHSLKGTSYTAYHRDSIIATGADLLDVLQPSLERLRAAGGGVVRLAASSTSRPFRMSRIAGSRPLPHGAQYVVDLPDNVSILGSRTTSGQPATVISIDAVIGNVFDAFFRQNIVIANLSIEANNKGNYIFNSFGSKDITIENVHVLYPNWTAFGHRAGTNITYRNCKAIGSNPYQGHGFAVGGSYNGGGLRIQDTGTKIINCEASGFAHKDGGQGVILRPNYVDWSSDFDPSLPNTQVLISGGRYFNNLVGVFISGSKDAVLENVTIENNIHNGVTGVSPYPYSSNTGTIAPENELRLTIRGGYIGWNGWWNSGHWPIPDSPTKAGVLLITQGALTRDAASRVENNNPSNFLINGVRYP